MRNATVEIQVLDAFILQDRKRLPVRFFGAFSGTALSRLS